jgi:hypothetical protein
VLTLVSLRGEVFSDVKVAWQVTTCGYIRSSDLNHNFHAAFRPTSAFVYKQVHHPPSERRAGSHGHYEVCVNKCWSGNEEIPATYWLHPHKDVNWWHSVSHSRICLHCVILGNRTHYKIRVSQSCNDPKEPFPEILLVAGNCGRGRGVIPSLAGPGEQS